MDTNTDPVRALIEQWRGRAYPITGTAELRLAECADELESALAQRPAAPVLAKHQPCGCVICTCEDERQCQGCGSKHCGNLADHPPYVAQQPVGVEEESAALSAEELATWLDRKYARHGEDEDRQAAAMLRALAQQQG